MKHFYGFFTGCIVAAWIVCTPRLEASGHLFAAVEGGRRVECGRIIAVESSAESLSARSAKVDVKALSSAMSGTGNLELYNFPVGEEQTGTVVLKRTRSVVDANTRIYAGNTFVAVPLVQSYAGVLKGEEGSRVFLCLVNGTLMAAIQRGNGTTYTLAPATESNRASDYVLLNETAATVGQELFTCRSEEASKILSAAKPITAGSAKKPTVLSSALLEVDVAVEADTKFFLETGGTIEKATAYIIGLMSMASVLYEDELNVTFYLPWIKVWTSNPADPYQSNGSGYDLAPKALAYWQDHYTDVERDLVHVLTAGGGGGVGYQFPLDNGGGAASLCTSSGLGASSPFTDHHLPTLAFTYGVYIVAHEIGHSFGAVHTHNCFWNPPLDTCMTRDDAQFISSDACFTLPVKPQPNSGSIMSYCAGINLAKGNGYTLAMTFLPPVAAYMRAQVEQVPCVTQPLPPTVILIAPRGDTSFVPGSNIAIRWSSAHVNAVSISYSSDGGAQWNSIVDNLPAATGTITWKAPDICSKNVLVRVVDVLHSDVADTSIVTFQIVGPHPDCLVAHYPLDGDMHDVVCGFFDGVASGAVPVNDRTGKANGAMSFNGTTGIAAPAFTFDAGQMTTTFWFSTSDLGSVGTIVGTNWEEGALFQTYLWNGTFGGAFWLKGEGVPRQVWATPVQKNTWYFGAVSYDGSSAKIYLNGQQVASIDAVGSLAATAGTPLYIGSRGTKEVFHGAIDDVRMYCRALSQSDIEQLANEAVAPQQAPVLVQPVNNAKVVDKPVTFFWDEVTLAQTYHLQVASDASMASGLIVDTDTIQSTFIPITAIDYGKTYYWRVAALNATGAGPWSSIWSFDLSSSTSVLETGSSTIMTSPYPNPCVNVASGTYNLIVPSFIRLSLCNALGEEVHLLEEGWKSAGIYPVHIDASSLPSGVYFLKIVAGDVVAVRRLVVMK